MNDIVFGEKLANQAYMNREGAYAIILNDKNEVATVRLPHGYFLPGGGMEGSENKETCLKRECLEELGWEVEVNQFIGKASSYYNSTYRNLHLYATGYFYLVKKLQQVTTPVEDDHELVWMNLETCLNELHLEHQAWAVKQVKKLLAGN